MKHASLLLLAFALLGCQPTQQAAPTSLPKQRVDGFFTSSLNSPPVGWKLKETMGFECRVFQYSGTGDYIDKLNGSLSGLAETGSKKGANAFINMRVTAGSFEIQGSKWHSSIFHLCGDYVVIE